MSFQVVKQKFEKKQKVYVKDHKDWKSPYDFERFFSLDLTEKDMLFLCYYFGKKKHEALLLQQGKDAASAVLMPIREMGRFRFHANSYILNATGLLSYEKETRERKKRTVTLHQTVEEVVCPNGDKVQTVLEEKEHVKHYTKKYSAFDTTTKNIEYVPGLVIDIDDHKEGLSEDVATSVAESIDFFLSEDYGIRPHFAVFSGRGLQLFFSVMPYSPNHKLLKNLAMDVQFYLRRAIAKILADLKEQNDCYKRLSIDLSTSVTRQLVRLPGSINYASGLTAHVVLEHAKDARQKLGDLVAVLSSSTDERPPSFCPPGFSSRSSFQNFEESKKQNAQKAEAARVRLLENRIHDDTVLLHHRGKGYRNHILCNMALSLLSLYDGRKDARELITERLLAADRPTGYFKDAAQAESFVRTVARYMKSKVGAAPLSSFRITNEMIVKNWLAITEEELDSLEFLTYGKQKKVQKSRETRRKEKVEKIRAILSAYGKQKAEGKVNISALARQFAISRQTLYTYLHKFGKAFAKKEKTPPADGRKPVRPSQGFEGPMLRFPRRDSESFGNKVPGPSRTSAFLPFRTAAGRNFPLFFSFARPYKNLNKKFLDTFLDVRWKKSKKNPFPTKIPPDFTEMFQFFKNLQKKQQEKRLAS